ncbi:MAG: c-type cytochrome [Anaerolineae bacterium]|nr:c-type cytochrome [Anaerolineae bacterium]
MLQSGRMLIERIENRVLVGIISFVAIMVLVGWVAINENARMASFTRQYNARSIERGAELFAANCSTCHGVDGRGITGRAPALNSPHFFGYDFIAAERRELNGLQRQVAELESEKAALGTELAAEGTTEERKAEIATRLAEIEVALADETRTARIAELEASKQAFVDSITLAVDNGYNIENPSRLAYLGWGGTLDNFVTTTLYHGRPSSVSYWPAPMVAWSQRANGPLRDDQIQDISNYILNWDKGDAWTLEDLLATQQFAIVPGLGEGVEATAPAIGGDVNIALAQLASLTGDPVRGEALYANRERSQATGARLGCGGCHYNGAQGPAFDGTYERVVAKLSTEAALAGYTVEQYLMPGAYVVSGYAAGAMPANFGQSMSAQDLADVVQYIKSTDPNYVPPVPAEPAAEGES